MIKQQIKYGLKNKKFLFIIILGFIIKLYSVINEIFPYISLQSLIINVTNSFPNITNAVDDPFNKYSLWVDSLKSFNLAIPILCSIPFATSYIDDVNSKQILFINLRTSHNNYRFSKLIANALIGGLAILIPSIIFSCLIFLIFNGNYETCYIADVFGGKYNELFKSHFFLYLIYHLFIEFLIGATYSTIALAVSSKTKNTIAILLSPFIFYTVISVIFSLIGFKFFSPERINQFYYAPNVSFIEIFIGLLLIFITTSIIFLYFTKKEFIYEESQKDI